MSDEIIFGLSFLSFIIITGLFVSGMYYYYKAFEKDNIDLLNSFCEGFGLEYDMLGDFNVIYCSNSTILDYGNGITKTNKTSYRFEVDDLRKIKEVDFYEG